MLNTDVFNSFKKRTPEDLHLRGRSKGSSSSYSVKCFKKLTFLTPWDAHVLNGWTLSQIFIRGNHCSQVLCRIAFPKVLKKTLESFLSKFAVAVSLRMFCMTVIFFGLTSSETDSSQKIFLELEEMLVSSWHFLIHRSITWT